MPSGIRVERVSRPPSVSDALFKEIARRLAEAYQPERIYLFGSVARGDATSDSDYDLMVIVPDDAGLERLSCDLAYKVVRGLERSGDFLVWTRSAFERRLHLKSSLPATICREGKLLYAA